MNTEIIQPRRQDYTKKAQRAYYERVKADPLKHREYLDRVNKSRRVKREKACLSKNQSICIKLDNGVITVI